MSGSEMIHYVTSEIVEITDDGSNIVLKTDQMEFFAELTLSGYLCEPPMKIQESTGKQRIQIHRKDGALMLRKGA